MSSSNPQAYEANRQRRNRSGGWLPGVLASGLLAGAVGSLLAQTPSPRTPAAGPDEPTPRVTLQWPAGYIEPNTPGMQYVAPDVPQGTGPYKAIMASDPGAPEFVLYYPANLSALGATKMPVLLWGNGSCTYVGNKFRNFLTEIASHGYLAIAGGPMGPPSAETITMASNNWTPSAIGPKPPARGASPSRQSVTVTLLGQGISWAIAENNRQGGKFYGKLDANAVSVMGQSCGAGLAASFGTDTRVKTIGVWSGSNKAHRDEITVPALYISGSEIYDVAYPGSLDDFTNSTKAPIFHGWRTGMTHLGTYRQYLGGELAPIATAWLDWQLKGDQTAAKWFRGATCTLCVDRNWHVQKKKIDELVATTIVSGQQDQPRTGRGRGGAGQTQGQQQDRTPIPGGSGSEPSPLLFHEAWTRALLTQPMVQENLGNRNLMLHIYGNAAEIRKTFHPVDDYTYTGETMTNWAITVSDKASTWDLSGTAKIRLKTQNTGYRFLHVVIKTAEGRYYVSEEGSPESSVWIERDYVFSDLHWRNLLMTDTPTNASNRRQPDPKRIPIIPTSKATPDLKNVDEVGFSDLMPGGWIPSTSRVAAFDLYGKAVPRK